MRPLGVGIPVYADLEYLELCRDLIEHEADFFEVSPETLWRSHDGRLVRNGYYPLYLQLRDRSRKPFVAHGLGFSLGTPLVDEIERRRTDAWLERLRDDHSEFRFEWLSEHLGWTCAEGLQAVLPLPLPLTAESVRAVGDRMKLLSSVTPIVAFENPATTFCVDDPRNEPEFFNAVCRDASCSLLLDLHNLYTQCLNFDLDPREYVDRIDLDRVLEIHVSGGSPSEPDWLPSRRSFRLDSHDGPVPEEVWSLLTRVRHRCPNLRGIVVERLNGTFSASEVGHLREEIRRAKKCFSC